MNHITKKILKDKGYLNKNFIKVDYTSIDEFYYIRDAGLLVITKFNNFMYIWNEHYSFAKDLLDFKRKVKK